LSVVAEQGGRDQPCSKYLGLSTVQMDSGHRRMGEAEVGMEMEMEGTAG
jgi:hypothetical protein